MTNDHRYWALLAAVFLALQLPSIFTDWDGEGFVAPFWICIATSAILRALRSRIVVHVHDEREDAA